MFPYLTIWQMSWKLWLRRLEQIGMLNYMQTLFDVSGILLDLIDHRLKFCNGLGNVKKLQNSTNISIINEAIIIIMCYAGKSVNHGLPSKTICRSLHQVFVLYFCYINWLSHLHIYLFVFLLLMLSSNFPAVTKFLSLPFLITCPINLYCVHFISVTNLLFSSVSQKTVSCLFLSILFICCGFIETTSV